MNATQRLRIAEILPTLSRSARLDADHRPRTILRPNRRIRREQVQGIG
jgi:hypothetical protein